MPIYYVDTAAGNDINAGTSAGAGNAWATIGKAAATVAAGDLVYVKASGTYTLTATVTCSTSGSTASGRIAFEGYTTTPGARDGRPLVTTATNSVPLFSVNNATSYLDFRHFKGTNTATTRAGMFAGTGTAGSTNVNIEDCVCDGCSWLYDGSLRAVSGLTVVGCESTNNTAGVIRNASFPAAITSPGDLILGCYFHGYTGPGYDAANQNTVLTVRDSVIVGGTKGISDGNTGSGRGFQLNASNCTIAGHSSHGFAQENAASVWILNLQNNVIYGNGGYGVSLLNTATKNDALTVANRANAYGGNTIGNRNNLSAGYGDVPLTSSPFTNSGAGDYSLNTTAGGGAACRAAGFPGAFPGGTTTGYPDIGAVEHPDPAGGSGPTYFAF